jgi:hypothetical protein
MVMRIAPDMFQDERYMCVTTNEVRTELVKNPKFKEKYPWRKDFIPKIKTLSLQQTQNDEVKLYLEIINSLIADDQAINTRTKRAFGLSRTDIRIAAYALANGYEVTTAEYNLSDFLEQQFQQTVIEPLELVNIWLKEDLIKWDSSHQTIMEEWKLLNEKPQSPVHIKEFERLSGYKYLGS